MFPKPKTPRSSSHLAWIRTLPCAWCRRPPPSEASHHGRRGVGIKSSDLDAIPLCGPLGCHHHHHGPRFAHLPPLPGAPLDFPVREWAAGYARGLRFKKAEAFANVLEHHEASTARFYRTTFGGR